MFQSDIDFAVWLNTRDKKVVIKERFVPTIKATLAAEYDNETENKRLLIRADRNNERKAA